MKGRGAPRSYRVGKVRRIDLDCEDCGHRMIATVEGETGFVCPSCKRLYPVTEAHQNLQRCPVCDCTRFYAQKDFNQAVGCTIMLAGAALVPLTYGISLPVVFGIDWLLHRRVPDMAVCYVCRSEYRGFPMGDRMQGFRHHMAEGFEKRREERRQRRTAPRDRPDAVHDPDPRG